jgi:hypothetical protein
VNKFYTFSLCAYFSLLGFYLQDNIYIFLNIDPILEPYNAEYREILLGVCPSKSNLPGTRYTINFVPKGDGWIGVCKPRLGGFTINIDREYWNTRATPEEKTQLMYHELTHCILDKDHSEDPNNYMYPTIIPMAYEDLIIQVKKDMQEYCNK